MTARYRHRSSVATGLLSREVTVDPITRAVYVGTPEGAVVEVTGTRRFSELASYTAGSQVAHNGITYTAKDDLTAGTFDPLQWNRLTEITPFDFGARANGTFDDTAAVQAALDECAANSGAESDDGYFIEVDLKGRQFTLTEPLTMNGPTYIGIIVRNGKLTPHPESTWAVDVGGRASGAMLIMDGGAARNVVRNVQFDCKFKTNGMVKAGFGNWTTVENCYFTEFEYWGFRHTGGGALFVTGSRFVEHLNAMPEVGTRKGRGMWLQASDSKIFENISNWSEYPLYLDFNEEEGHTGSTCLIANNHFYNGQPFSGTPVVNPCIIYVGERSSGCYFTNNYYDKGQIIVRCRRAVFSGGRFINATGSTTLDSYFTLQPNSFQSNFNRFMLSGPFDWPTTTTAKLLAVDESEAAYTGNKAALEQRSAWPMINGDVINEVRIVQDPDETTGLTPFVVHSFGSSVSQSRAVFRNTGTTETSVNDMPFIGSQGDNLVFGAGGEVPKWFVEPVSQYLGGATSDPLTRIHIAGNGTGNRIIQEAVPVDSGASAPVLEHRMTGLGNSSGFRVYDKDFLVSDLPVLSHAIKANKQSASFAIPRTYTMTFSLSETGAANAADVLTLSSDALYPAYDNVTDLGKPSSRWQQLHAGTTEIAVSDERLKEQIADIQDEILDAWGLVRYRMFKFKDAAAEKGDAARWHFGPIAQEVRDAFASKGLDATMYAPFCYDHWGVQYDPTGTITADAGDIYSLRLQECAMIEAAYMRRELARIVDILNA